MGMRHLSFACLVAGFVCTNAMAQQPDGYVYRNAEIGLTVSYPTGLQPETTAVLGHYSYRTVLSIHPEADAEHRGADPCTPVLSIVGMGPDKPVDPNEQAISGRQVRIQPTGGVSLSEIKRSCLEKKEKPSDFVAAEVANIQDIEGFSPLAKTIQY